MLFRSLAERHASGEGQVIDISLLEAQMALMENAVVRYLSTGVIPQPVGAAHPYEQLTRAYGLPFAGFLASMLLFLGLYLLLPRRRRRLTLVFAALAVAIYYWFRLPVSLGLEGEGSHTLLDLGDLLGAAWVLPLRLGFTGVLIGLLVLRKPGSGWTGRVRRAT